MVKSFLNSLFGGLGRTFGRILAYILIGLIFFFIYSNVDAASFTPSSINSGTCTSNKYDIEKSNGDLTYGSIGTSYNIFFHYISFYSTYNLQPNKYYDIIITFRSNISNNILNNDYGENLGVTGIHVFQTSSLCGGHTGEVTISGYSISGKKLTIRVMNGSSLVDYWQVYTRFTFNGSNGIDSTTIEAVDLSGSSGIIENANDNTNSIINNNNSNTEDIINNNNENTQDIINNQTELLGSCHTNLFNYLNYTYNDSRYNLSSNTNTITLTLTANNDYTGGSFPLTYSLNLKPNTSYYFRSDSTRQVTSTGRADFYIYDSNNSLVHYTTGTDNFSFTTNSSSTYSFRIYITSEQRSGDTFTFSKMALYEGGVYDVYQPYNEKICNSKIDDTNSLIGTVNQKLDSFLSLPTVRLVLFTDSVQDWANYVNNPVGNFLLLPVQLVSKINTISQNSCTPFNLGSLLGTSLTMSCFTLSDVLPSSLVNIIDVIASMSLSFVILKKIYETITNMITLGGENEVKSYFHVPTPMEFMGSIFGG